MAASEEDLTTLSGTTEHSDVPGREPELGLTVLSHSDVGRIGDRAWFADFRPGQKWQVSRTLLDFVGPDGQSTGSLGARKLSRKPVEFCAESGGGLSLRCDPASVKLEADGRAVSGRADIDRNGLARGVVLSLNNAVALLVHYPSRASATAADMPELIGQSRGMDRLRQQIGRVAGSMVPVLVRGESGTGKELVARAIHAHSPRAGGPMISVNMAAVPQELAASELFGHEAGSFSGARKARTGLFVAADGGTLFLDEIGHSPMSVQLALLRALETGEITPVGRNRPMVTDVRVVAATDRNLIAAMADGSFHAALLERLGGIELHLPPLRERREDIPILLLRFLREFLPAGARDSLLDPAQKPWLKASLVAGLVRYDWPRNVRQLRNVAQEMALLSASRPFVAGPKVETILAELAAAAPIADSQPSTADVPESVGRREQAPAAYRSAHDITRVQLRAVLRDNQYVIYRAAKVLQISQQSMYRLLDSHKILYAKKISRALFLEHARATGGDMAEMARRLEVSERALRLRKKALDL